MKRFLNLFSAALHHQRHNCQHICILKQLNFAPKSVPCGRGSFTTSKMSLEQKESVGEGMSSATAGGSSNGSNDVKEEQDSNSKLPENQHCSTTSDVSSHQQKTSGRDGSDMAKPLSKRAMKRQRKLEKIQRAKEKRAANKTNPWKESDVNTINDESSKETSYYFENGLRKVYPYYYKFATHAKGRWVGQKVLDVFAKEFANNYGYSHKEAIEKGVVKVNGEPITVDYVFKDNDYIENIMHRHEVPVTADPIEIILNTEDMLVVNKPASIPVHPCGRYRHNSVVYILAREQGFHNLRGVHRIDRLTSGLLIYCKTEQMTKRLMADIVKRRVQKEYVCKVDGVFPSEEVVSTEPLDVLTHRCGLYMVKQGGKESKTTFNRLSTDGTTSILKCQPHTGRTHQIRVHLQYLGYPIVNDPLYNTAVWGPAKGKGGDFGKPIDQLIEEVIKEHSRDRFVDKDTESPEECGDSTAEVVSVPCSSSKESEETERPRKKMRLDPASEDSQVIYDPDCYECRNKHHDPQPENLVMYLHSHRYKGPGWEYATPLPKWAQTVEEGR